MSIFNFLLSDHFEYTVWQLNLENIMDRQKSEESKEVWHDVSVKSILCTMFALLFSWL